MSVSMEQTQHFASLLGNALAPNTSYQRQWYYKRLNWCSAHRNQGPHGHCWQSRATKGPHPLQAWSVSTCWNGEQCWESLVSWIMHQSVNSVAKVQLRAQQSEGPFFSASVSTLVQLYSSVPVLLSCLSMQYNHCAGWMFPFQFSIRVERV